MIHGLKSFFPGAKVAVANKRNAFDVVLDGKMVWDGSSMGPPRALKFNILEGTKLHDMVVAVGKKNAK